MIVTPHAVTCSVDRYRKLKARHYAFALMLIKTKPYFVRDITCTVLVVPRFHATIEVKKKIFYDIRSQGVWKEEPYSSVVLYC